MYSLKAGKSLCEFVGLCYSARRSFLISGHHGIGKSELLEQAAAELGIEFVCRDLSLMEPPDLVGLPKAKRDSTTYLPPEFLPRNGRGLLVFEELNRCERFMRAPCLQLLTTRTLNDYALPSGWLPVAAINPADGDYEVADLDPALVSRFVCVKVVPDRKEWLDWSERNQVHLAVRDYVESDTSIFDDAESNPRAWKYVSDILWEAEKQEIAPSTLRAAVLGLVGDTRGAAFLRVFKKKDRPLTATEVLKAYTKHRDDLQRWIHEGRLDLVEASLLAVEKYLQPQRDYDQVCKSRNQLNYLGSFLYDLPGDLHEAAKQFFTERGYRFPVQNTAKKAKKRS